MLRLSWPDGTFMSLKGGLWAHWPCDCWISVVDSCGTRGGEVVGAKEPCGLLLLAGMFTQEAGCDVVRSIKCTPEGVHSGS